MPATEALAAPANVIARRVETIWEEFFINIKFLNKMGRTKTFPTPIKAARRHLI
jgi:hypothetical protein